jgi:hypothetical protein
MKLETMVDGKREIDRVEYNSRCPKCYGTGEIRIGGSFGGPVTIHSCDCYLFKEEKMKFDPTCFYTFVREKEKLIPQVLEFRSGSFNWVSNDNLYDCCGYFKGDKIPKIIGTSLKESIDGGYKVSVCEFPGDYESNPGAAPPKVYQLNNKTP